MFPEKPIETPCLDTQKAKKKKRRKTRNEEEEKKLQQRSQRLEQRRESDEQKDENSYEDVIELEEQEYIQDVIYNLPPEPEGRKLSGFNCKP